jgi:hypothetical protein
MVGMTVIRGKKPLVAVLCTALVTGAFTALADGRPPWWAIAAGLAGTGLLVLLTRGMERSWLVPGGAMAASVVFLHVLFAAVSPGPAEKKSVAATDFTGLTVTEQWVKLLLCSDKNEHQLPPGSTAESILTTAGFDPGWARYAPWEVGMAPPPTAAQQKQMTLSADDGTLGDLGLGSNALVLVHTYAIVIIGGTLMLRRRSNVLREA